MNRILASLILCSVTFVVPPLATSAHVTIAWSPVGNPGNTNDPVGGGIEGGVAYSYNIAKYDVTNSQYVEFLNSKDPTGADTLGLFDNGMSSAPYGGIDYMSSAANGNKYSVIPGNGNHPVNFVSWYDAIRFANWLNNGQGNGDTETGAYTLGPLGAGGVPIEATSITRNPNAVVFLPSDNEWYKAAYYNPATNSYFTYGTGSNMPPIAAGPSNLPNSANYNSVVNALTDVGAYSGTSSPYHAYDMVGNVWQWEEDEHYHSDGFRGYRGGALFTSTTDEFGSGYMVATREANEGYGIGFQLASIPEPSTLILAAFGGIALLVWGCSRA